MTIVWDEVWERINDCPEAEEGEMVEATGLVADRYYVADLGEKGDAP